MSGEPLRRGDVVNLLQRHHRPLSARRLMILITQGQEEASVNYGVMLSTLRQWARDDAKRQREESSSDRIVEVRRGVFSVQRATEEPSRQSDIVSDIVSGVVSESRAPNEEAVPTQSTSDRQAPQRGLSLGARSPLTARGGQQRAVKQILAGDLREAQRISEYLTPYPASPVQVEDVLSAIEHYQDDFSGELWSHIAAEASRTMEVFNYTSPLLKLKRSNDEDAEGDQANLEYAEDDAEEYAEDDAEEYAEVDAEEFAEVDAEEFAEVDAEEYAEDDAEESYISDEGYAALEAHTQELQELASTLDQLNQRYHQSLLEALTDYLSSCDMARIRSLSRDLLVSQGYEHFEQLNTAHDDEFALLAHHPTEGVTLVIVKDRADQLERRDMNALKRSIKSLHADRAMFVYFGDVDEAIKRHATRHSIFLLSALKFAHNMIEHQVGVRRAPSSRAHIDLEALRTLDTSS